MKTRLGNWAFLSGFKTPMVLGDGSRVRIAPTDKQGNAHAKRKKSHIDYAAQGGE